MECGAEEPWQGSGIGDIGTAGSPRNKSTYIVHHKRYVTSDCSVSCIDFVVTQARCDVGCWHVIYDG